MNSHKAPDFKKLLREHGYRITPARIALLVFLHNTQKPLTAREIQKQTPHIMDKVTLYRALEDFTRSKFVVKINLQNTITYYEFHHKDHHHHHIMCEKCGKIEDIENCKKPNLQKEALRNSKEFSIINSHSLEFFGLCKKCS